MMSIMKKKMMIILLQNFSLSTELGDEFVTRPVKIEAEFEMFEKLTKGNIVRFIILFHILNWYNFVTYRQKGEIIFEL